MSCSPARSLKSAQAKICRLRPQASPTRSRELKRATLNLVINVGSLDARRDLTDVRDTVDAYRGLMAHGISGRLYNVCSGEAHKVGDLLDRPAGRHADACSDPDRPRSCQTSRQHVAARETPRGSATRSAGSHRSRFADTLRDLINYWRGVIRAS